jgi:ferric-dicitrate binding protein FerR (iron transport regulator)
MNHYEYNILLEKYLTGECTENERALINTWYEKQASDEMVLSPNEKIQVGKNIWNKMSKNLFQFHWITMPMKIAATIGILLLSGFLGIKYFDSQNTIEMKGASKGIEMKNNSASYQTFTLEDGSKITLAANSKLIYPQHFGDKLREVFLEGDAFFDIKRNPVKPFIIHTGKLTTEVLGTSFGIKTFANKKTIEVNVLSGRVSVFDNSNQANKIRKGIILTPNQKMTFKEETSEIIASIVDKPIPITDTININFEDQKIQEVIEALRKLYGLEIIIENPSLQNCPFTGDLNDLPLLTQLELLSKSVGARIEQRGTSIFLIGGGCK